MNLVLHEKGSAAVDRYANSTPTIAVIAQRHRHAAHPLTNYPAVAILPLS